MRFPKPSSIIGLLLVICMVSGPMQLYAQEENATPSGSGVLISLGPSGLPDGSRFEIEVEAGGAGEMVAVMQNHGSEPVDLRTFTTGIVPAINGGLQIAEPGSEPVGSTLWLGYEGGEFTLQPGEVMERVISVQVPADTPPGQYVNAVSLETVNPVNEGDGSAFNQYLRKVVSIYVVVPGDVVISAEFGDVEAEVFRGTSVVSIPIENTGNTRINLIGLVTVINANGDVISQLDVALSPIYMGQTILAQVAIRPAPPPGDYTIAYTFSDLSTETVVADNLATFEMPEEIEVVEAPISFPEVVIEANDEPITFANVTVDVEANSPFRSTRLTLSVFHNDDFVEDFVLAANLSLPQGVTTVSQRYLPATSWESGTYTFSLKIESTEGDQTTLLFEEEDVATLEVP